MMIRITRPLTVLITAVIATLNAISAQDVIHSAEGDNLGDAFGCAVDNAGDVDGDGIADYIVGAHRYGWKTPTLGYARIFSGKTGNIVYTVRALSTEYFFSADVAGLGDVNGDKRSDFAVSVQDGGRNPVVIVYSGKDASRIKIISEPLTFPANSGFGEMIAGIGDVNQDGYPDLAVGASSANSNAGLLGVFSGKDWSLLFTLKGSASGDRFGKSAARLGDVDADGHDDFIVGADAYVSSAIHGKGYVRVYSGKTGTVLYTWAGDANGDRFGRSVNQAGDVNRDGVNDCIVGAIQPAGAGYARVFSGKTGSILHTFTGAPVSSKQGSAMGAAVCAAGDIDSDGYGDVVVTSTIYRSYQAYSIGRVDVFSGQSGKNLYSIQGLVQGDIIGTSVEFMGDIDSDGKPDILVGSEGDNNSTTSKVRSGSARVYGGLSLARAIPFGVGCQSTSKLMVANAISLPRIGGTLHVRVENVPTAPTGGVIFLGVSNQKWHAVGLPLDLAFVGMPTCKLLVSGDVEISFFMTSGSVYDWKLLLPYKHNLLGSTIYAQLWLLDPKANSTGIAVTHGLKLVVGG